MLLLLITHMAKIYKVNIQCGTSQVIIEASFNQL